ncbi:DUF6020 family protein, partial [Dolichospermum sp. ST_sed3]|nr:DUF6020 family protein [Dolichospermum sp. ST_sed3]
NSDGSKVDVAEYQLGDGWEIREGEAVSYQNQPAILRWQGLTSEAMKLTLGSHEWSGIAKVIWDSKEQVINLFPTKGNREIILEVPGTAFNTAYIIVSGLTLGILLFNALVILIVLPFSKINKFDLRIKNFWICLALIPVVVWVVYCLTYWPGLVVSDFLDQWSQVLNFRFDNNHPAFHTLTMWLISRIFPSPGLVSLAQIITLGLLIGHIFKRQIELGINKLALIVTSLFLALSPVTTTMVISLVKDIPFSIAFLWFSWQIVEILISQGQWLTSKKNIILFAISAALVSLFRHNGMPIILVIVVIIFAFHWKNYKNLLIFSLLFTLMIFVIKGPVYSLFRVNTTKTVNSLPFFILPYIGAHLKANTPISMEEKEFLDEIMNTDNDWEYNQYTMLPLVFNPKLNSQLVARSSNRIIYMFFQLTKRNPSVTLNHLITINNMIWEINLPPGGIHHTVAFVLNSDGTVTTTVPDPYQTGLKQDSKIPQLITILAKWFTIISYRFYVYVWRPALQLYLLIFLNVVYAVRFRNTRSLMITLPVVIQSGLLFLISPNPEYRYQFPVFLTSILLYPLLLFSVRDVFQPSTSKTEVQEGDA